MNEAFEKVRAFAAKINDEEMDMENTAVLILSLDSKGMPDGENRTSALIKGAGKKVIELLCCTLLQEPELKHLLTEAMQISLLRNFLNMEKDTSDDMPAKGEPDPETVSAN